MPTPTISDEKYGNGHVARRAAPSAQANREYVAGGSFPWTENYLQSLPVFIDDVSRDFGDDIYDRMLLDPQLAASVATLKAGIIHGTMNLTPRAKEEEPDGDTAREIADFCRQNLEGLERPFVTETLWDMLDALPYGNKVAEQLYDYDDEPVDEEAFPVLAKTLGSGADGTIPGGKPLILRALKVKPRRTTAFVVDAFLNVVGLLAILPGHPWALLAGTLITDPAAVENLLPRRKFAVLTFRSKDGDPRGQSILRPAYGSWWFKRQVEPEYLAYISQFARPTLVGTTAEGASDDVELDDNGDPIIDPVTSDPVSVKPEVAMNAALQNVRNGTTIGIPFGAKVDVLQVQGEGAPFITAFDHLNREMALSVLLQTLATMEAQFGTRAQSQTHQDVLGLLTGLLRSWVEEFIIREILSPLVEYNYGRQWLHLVPKVSFGDTGPEDLAALLTALATVGFKLDPSQFPEIDDLASLPKRSPESVEHAQQMQQAALEGLKASVNPDGSKEPDAEPGQSQSNPRQPAGAAA